MMTTANSPAEALAAITETKTTHAQVFDSSNRNWSPNQAYNLLFLKTQENWMNDRLNAGGYVFLNDVHDALGFKRTPAGQVVGWIKDGGVGYVSFGLFSLPSVPTDNQVIPLEAITLEFNVDGVIYNLI